MASSSAHLENLKIKKLLKKEEAVTMSETTRSPFDEDRVSYNDNLLSNSILNSTLPGFHENTTVGNYGGGVSFTQTFSQITYNIDQTLNISNLRFLSSDGVVKQVNEIDNAKYNNHFSLYDSKGKCLNGGINGDGTGGEEAVIIQFNKLKLLQHFIEKHIWYIDHQGNNNGKTSLLQNTLPQLLDMDSETNKPYDIQFYYRDGNKFERFFLTKKNVGFFDTQSGYLFIDKDNSDDGFFKDFGSKSYDTNESEGIYISCTKYIGKTGFKDTILQGKTNIDNLDISGNLDIEGNLHVKGKAFFDTSATLINSTNLIIKDKKIQVGFVDLSNARMNDTDFATIDKSWEIQGLVRRSTDTNLEDSEIIESAFNVYSKLGAKNLNFDPTNPINPTNNPPSFFFDTSKNYTYHMSGHNRDTVIIGTEDKKKALLLGDLSGHIVLDGSKEEINIGPAASTFKILSSKTDVSGRADFHSDVSFNKQIDVYGDLRVQYVDFISGDTEQQTIYVGHDEMNGYKFGTTADQLDTEINRTLKMIYNKTYTFNFSGLLDSDTSTHGHPFAIEITFIDSTIKTKLLGGTTVASADFNFKTFVENNNFTFKDIKNVRYLCTLHSNMNGIITVIDSSIKFKKQIDVSGRADFRSDVTFNKQIDVSGHADFQSDVSFNSNLKITNLQNIKIKNSSTDTDLKTILDNSYSFLSNKIRATENRIGTIESNYVTTTNLTTTLNSYVQNTTLNNYVQSSTLNSYVQSSTFNSTLNSYATNSRLNSYVQNSIFYSTLNIYATKDYVNNQVGGPFGRRESSPYDGRDMSHQAQVDEFGNREYSFKNFFESYLDDLSDTTKQTQAEWPIFEGEKELKFYIDITNDNTLLFLKWNNNIIQKNTQNIIDVPIRFFPPHEKDYPFWVTNSDTERSPKIGKATWTNMFQITAKNVNATTSAIFSGRFQYGLSHPDYNPDATYGLSQTNPRSRMIPGVTIPTDTTHYLVQLDMSDHSLKWNGTITHNSSDDNEDVVLTVTKNNNRILNTNNRISSDGNLKGLPTTVGRNKRLLIKLHTTLSNHQINNRSFLYEHDTESSGYLYSPNKSSERIKGRALKDDDGNIPQQIPVTIYVEPMVIQNEPDLSMVTNSLIPMYQKKTNIWSENISNYHDVIVAAHDTYIRNNIQRQQGYYDFAPYRSIPDPPAIYDLHMADSGPSCPYDNPSPEHPFLYGDNEIVTSKKDTFSGLCGWGYGATGGISTGRFYDWVYIYEIGENRAFAKFYEPIDGVCSPEDNNRNFTYTGLLTNDGTPGNMWMQPVMHKKISLEDNYQHFYQIVQYPDGGTTEPKYNTSGHGKTPANEKLYYRFSPPSWMNTMPTMVIKTSGERATVDLNFTRTTDSNGFSHTDGLTPLTPKKFTLDKLYAISESINELWYYIVLKRDADFRTIGGNGNGRLNDNTTYNNVIEQSKHSDIFIIPSKCKQNTLAIGSNQNDTDPLLINTFYYMHGGQLGFANVNPRQEAKLLLQNNTTSVNDCHHNICAVFQHSGWNGVIANDTVFSNVAFATLKRSDINDFHDRLTEEINLTILTHQFATNTYSETFNPSEDQLIMDPYGLIRVIDHSSHIGSGWATSYINKSGSNSINRWNKFQVCRDALSRLFPNTPVLGKIANIYYPFSERFNSSDEANYLRSYPQFGCTPWNPMVRAAYRVDWITDSGTLLNVNTSLISNDISELDKNKILRWTIYEDVNIWSTMWNGECHVGVEPNNTFNEWYNRKKFAVPLYIKYRNDLTSVSNFTRYISTINTSEPPTDAQWLSNADNYYNNFNTWLVNKSGQFGVSSVPVKRYIEVDKKDGQGIQSKFLTELNNAGYLDTIKDLNNDRHYLGFCKLTCPIVRTGSSNFPFRCLEDIINMVHYKVVKGDWPFPYHQNFANDYNEYMNHSHLSNNFCTILPTSDLFVGKHNQRIGFKGIVEVLFEKYNWNSDTNEPILNYKRNTFVGDINMNTTQKSRDFPNTNKLFGLTPYSAANPYDIRTLWHLSYRGEKMPGGHFRNMWYTDNAADGEYYVCHQLDVDIHHYESNYNYFKCSSSAAIASLRQSISNSMKMRKVAVKRTPADVLHSSDGTWPLRNQKDIFHYHWAQRFFPWIFNKYQIGDNTAFPSQYDGKADNLHLMLYQARVYTDYLKKNIGGNIGQTHNLHHYGTTTWDLKDDNNFSATQTNLDPREIIGVGINYFSYKTNISVTLKHESFGGTGEWSLSDPTITSKYNTTNMPQVKMFSSTDSNYHIGTTPWSPLVLNNYTEWPDWIRLPWMLGGKFMKDLKSLINDYNQAGGKSGTSSWWTKNVNELDILNCSIDLLWAITNYRTGTTLPIHQWVAPFFKNPQSSSRNSRNIFGPDKDIINKMEESKYAYQMGSGSNSNLKGYWIESPEKNASETENRCIDINSTTCRFKNNSGPAFTRPISEVKCIFPVGYIKNVESFRGHSDSTPIRNPADLINTLVWYYITDRRGTSTKLFYAVYTNNTDADVTQTNYQINSNVRYRTTTSLPSKTNVGELFELIVKNGSGAVPENSKLRGHTPFWLLDLTSIEITAHLSEGDSAFGKVPDSESADFYTYNYNNNLGIEGVFPSNKTIDDFKLHPTLDDSRGTLQGVKLETGWVPIGSSAKPLDSPEILLQLIQSDTDSSIYSNDTVFYYLARTGSTVQNYQGGAGRQLADINYTTETVEGKFNVDDIRKALSTNDVNWLYGTMPWIPIPKNTVEREYNKNRFPYGHGKHDSETYKFGQGPYWFAENRENSMSVPPFLVGGDFSSMLGLENRIKLNNVAGSRFERTWVPRVIKNNAHVLTFFKNNMADKDLTICIHEGFWDYCIGSGVITAEQNLTPNPFDETKRRTSSDVTINDNGDHMRFDPWHNINSQNRILVGMPPTYGGTVWSNTQLSTLTTEYERRKGGSSDQFKIKMKIGTDIPPWWFPSDTRGPPDSGAPKYADTVLKCVRYDFSEEWNHDTKGVGNLRAAFEGDGAIAHGTFKRGYFPTPRHPRISFHGYQDPVDLPHLPWSRDPNVGWRDDNQYKEWLDNGDKGILNRDQVKKYYQKVTLSIRSKTDGGEMVHGPGGRVAFDIMLQPGSVYYWGTPEDPTFYGDGLHLPAGNTEDQQWNSYYEPNDRRVIILYWEDPTENPQELKPFWATNGNYWYVMVYPKGTNYPDTWLYYFTVGGKLLNKWLDETDKAGTTGSTTFRASHNSHHFSWYYEAYLPTVNYLKETAIGTQPYPQAHFMTRGNLSPLNPMTFAIGRLSTPQSSLEGINVHEWKSYGNDSTNNNLKISYGSNSINNRRWMWLAPDIESYLNSNYIFSESGGAAYPYNSRFFNLSDTDKENFVTQENHIGGRNRMLVVHNEFKYVYYKEIDSGFTGVHFNAPFAQKKPWERRVGQLVRSSGHLEGVATISHAYTKMILTDRKEDPGVYGVVAGVKEDGRLLINSLGEGAVCVVDTAPVDVGSLLCSSQYRGLATVQNDTLIRSYTVAKAMAPCDFTYVGKKTRGQVAVHYFSIRHQTMCALTDEIKLPGVRDIFEITEQELLNSFPQAISVSKVTSTVFDDDEIANNKNVPTSTETVWRELSEEEAKENLQYARLRFKDETTEEMLQDYVKALGLDYIDDTNTPYELYDLIREATSLKVAFMPVIYLC